MSPSLAAAGRTPEHDRRLAEHGGALALARVAAVHRGTLELVTDDGPPPGLRHGPAAPRGEPPRSTCRRWATGSPTTPSRAPSTPCSERTSALVRAARDGREPAGPRRQRRPRGRRRVDEPASSTLGRIERMLTLAADAPADAVVVPPRGRLDPDPAARVASVRAALGGAATVLPVSTLDGSGARRRRARCSVPGVTGVLLGASGVGKTTLLNRLAGGDRATAPVRGADDRDRHTTTWRELVALAGGALVIDTPGLKLPRIWEQASGLASVFSDIEELARACRFADCRHTGEPGCAVAEALGDGRLAPSGSRRRSSSARAGVGGGRARDERARARAQGARPAASTASRSGSRRRRDPLGRSGGRDAHGRLARHAQALEPLRGAWRAPAIPSSCTARGRRARCRRRSARRSAEVERGQLACAGARVGDGREGRDEQSEARAGARGAERHEPPGAVGDHHHERGGQRDGQREGGEEAQQRDDPQRAAEHAPRRRRGARSGPGLPSRARPRRASEHGTAERGEAAGGAAHGEHAARSHPRRPGAAWRGPGGAGRG